MGKNDSLLLVIDVQNDFCDGGALAVEKSWEIIPVINLLVDGFENVAATQDWHPYDHKSFASNHEGKKPMDVINLDGVEQVLWPDHCVSGTAGADFHQELTADAFQMVIRKGFRAELDSYSAFFENDRKTPTGLEGYLRTRGIDKVYLAGLATDYCVYYSAMDANSLGFDTYLITDACRGVDFPKGNVDKALTTMKDAGVELITSKDVI